MGSDTDTPNTDTATEPDPVAATEAATPPADDTASVFMTQEDVDRVVATRLAREKAKFSDYADLKAKADQLDALEEQQKTELERAQTAAEEAIAKAAAAEERANSVLVKATVIAEATRQGAVDPETVHALLDQAELTIENGDQVTGVEAAVTALLEAKPFLAGSRSPGPGDGGTRTTAEAGDITTETDPDKVIEWARGNRRI
jgi:hypothetical protein